ncbi:2-oxo-4-hydroxy-4-carboxy-5-ureidoimidazoline decarboxylase [Amycolatopsis cynarae]|uniref:2-oxo-4-hydroxy-4-carboxy-5-ureidoimidazoline decarboxylase n=1 Tax=Amycolatopsis cynarae TaxID=2995223 RepID=A0ABY7AW70_9PSEU|nr:2-oxo-4-hydroxy-4-carboxy-5-ureidoimidazoline decarboxylase [Amycolatopsis sp. HUAS 11-8]WAL64226.1 2-oxo-4-hydroxy-4-carboxy-5-ureidoimidazoline decarboxylase [Amycolatopsis sp. HUAS 11-8]
MPLDLAGFNTTPVDQAATLLTGCLEVPRWVDTVVDGRPYPSLAALRAVAAEITLTPEEIRRAMAAHPRIGERPTALSRSEQSGVDSAAADRFRTANAEYEQRFGHVFLIRAAGRSGEEMLAALRERMRNDPETELAVAGRELVEIALLRLEKAVTA